MTPNPLLPSTYDMLWSVVALGFSVVGVAAMVLCVVAIVSVVREPTVAGRRQLGWIVAFILAPVAGPLIWFLLARPSPVRAPEAQATHQ